MGFYCDSFYRFTQLYEQDDELALAGINRKGKTQPKNWIDPAIEKKIVKMALDNPALEQQWVSNKLRKIWMIVSPGGVRLVWPRYDLEIIKKRCTTLEAKVAQEGLILTESQLAAMEKKKEEDKVRGQFETEHPGYLGAQDTCYLGTIKGIGRIKRQTSLIQIQSATLETFNQPVCIPQADS